MKVFPQSLVGWLRYGFVAAVTAVICLLIFCGILTDFRSPPHHYINRAANALQIALALLFFVSIALLQLDRRLALLGIIVSVTAYGLSPIVTAIKEE